MDILGSKSELMLKSVFQLKEVINEPEFWLDAVDSATKLEPIELV